MERSLVTLLSEATESLLPPACHSGAMAGQLRNLLGHRNGFYAYDGALLVRATCQHQARGHGIEEPTIEEWNRPDGWRALYPQMPAGLEFFAEDVFGDQFAIANDSVVGFDPETGELTDTWTSFHDWLSTVVADPDIHVGRGLLTRWRHSRGQLERNQRLVPRVPFVLGGEYEVDNLVAMTALRGMQVRADLARQLAGVPDGSAIQLRVTD
jgi:hypothetical protein